MADSSWGHSSLQKVRGWVTKHRDLLGHERPATELTGISHKTSWCLGHCGHSEAAVTQGSSVPAVTILMVEQPAVFSSLPNRSKLIFTMWELCPCHWVCKHMKSKWLRLTLKCMYLMKIEMRTWTLAFTICDIISLSFPAGPGESYEQMEGTCESCKICTE
jgi:hypothetical protein